MLTGIDVSQHQGSFNWKAAKADGHAFAFVKASEGVGFRDPQFTRNWNEAAATGLLVGAYHFARVSYVGTDIAEDARREAAWFVAQIGEQAGRLPPVLDIEWDKKANAIPAADVVRWAKAFLLEVLETTGRTPIVYTGPSFWRYRLAKTSELLNYPLWTASWTAGSKPKAIPGWPWTFWQYTNKLPCAGKLVDGDRFGGTHIELEELAGTVPKSPDAQTTKVEPLPYPSPMSLLDNLVAWFAKHTKDVRTDRAKPLDPT